MYILLASNNEHKRREIDGILEHLAAAVTILQPRDLGFSFDVVEDGTTFAANALLKAQGLAALIRGELRPGTSLNVPLETVQEKLATLCGDQPPPVLADDSGICVHALENRPGIYSARYGNSPDTPPLDDRGRNALLLQELQNHRNRGAHYVCNAVLLYDADRYLQAQETWHGEIVETPRDGRTGFGYDPVFLLPRHGQTVAEIPQAEKDRISHRAKALRALARAAGWIEATGT
ncbi:hypothetical protein AU468_13045 [Alkalispirochaeta sphaeroplastigenens]|uniref:dITP/XTP pyrophosphatase n=1 Tax=Alkalispirochaeta sphaeroplastigenens TaxID=1187066 RepID=A0A2S4JG48_9SPIO|nr:non-canonical purine NTP pyrophosphatase [Alkalispirochaeta sphaeroplastigenens]POQ98511.1 hypothetical protein AU468_13045 [Alkalispirochaeta sphaeroplastigenens]